MTFTSGFRACSVILALSTFGVLAYELYAGQPPFTGQTFAELALAHTNKPAPPLPGGNKGLSDLLLRCLDKDPNKRPRAEAIAASLRAIAAGLPPGDSLANEPDIDPFAATSAGANAALAETKERLIALQMEQRTGETRGKSLAAEAAQAKRAADQAVEQEMRQRQLITQLQSELAGLRRETAAEVAPAPHPARPTTPTARTADNLTEIKGIGKVIERRLHELGVTSFRQLAELSPAEAKRINEAIDFPGRVERERWIEQARALLRD